MPDRIDNVPSLPNPSHSDGPQKKKGIQSEWTKAQNLPQGEREEKVLGMWVTKEEKEKIYSNLAKQVMQQIKKDQAEQEKAIRNLRHAAEGEPLET